MELYGDLFMFTSGWTFEFENFELLMKKVAMNIQMHVILHLLPFLLGK